MFKSPSQWKELIGSDDRFAAVETWEMDCFEEAWGDWLASDHKYAGSDRPYLETVIRPYTCLAGICIRLK